MRVSIIDYLNAIPLNMAFKDGLYNDGLELIYDFPSQCADNLAAGQADAGLISSIEYQRIPSLKVVSGVCIASRRKVRSVVIVTKRDFRDIRTIALDRFSRSSIALCRLLFHRKCGKLPKMITMAPQLDKMLETADAALVIGDAALRQEGHKFQTIDLAELWFEETGLPFVFAFWAVNDRAARKGLPDIFRAARDYGLQQLPNQVEALARRFQMERFEIDTYFHDNIHYDLGQEEKESLHLFYTYSSEYGIIPKYRDICFI